MDLQPITRNTKFTNNDVISIPINHLPLFRSEMAVQKGVARNLLFRTWGGLGDQLCAEPTMRYALNVFKDVDISLASYQPELFKHLKFKKVYDLNDIVPNYDKFLLLDTITPPDDSNLVWQFFSHMLTNCVDFPSLCSIRMQLPVADKEIFCSSVMPPVEKRSEGIYIHAGRHWESKTFPKSFWNAVINEIADAGVLPILIGANTDDNRGTVDVDAKRCHDLRNQTPTPELAWLMQRAKVLLTNDSSPLHFAASSDPLNPVDTGLAWIGYVATCKHPDMITHWRHGFWQWRERNFGKGGHWDIVDHCPNKNKKIECDKVDAETLASWLPDPIEYAHWAVEKFNAKN